MNDRSGARMGGSSRERSALEAVLLDVDGTLVDSNDAHAQAWSDVLREAGHDIGSERIRPLIGMGGDKILPRLIGVDAESEEGKRLTERRTEVFCKEYLPAVRAFLKVGDLLQRMRDDRLRLVVASSAAEDELRGLLRVAGVEWLLDDATSSDDADESKPDPDIVKAALKKARARPEQCVMIGDTPYDVAAATRAGVAIIGVRSGGWSDDDLQGAVAVYDDAADLLKHYGESAIGSREAEGGRREAGLRRQGDTGLEPPRAGR